MFEVVSIKVVWIIVTFLGGVNVGVILLGIIEYIMRKARK